MSKITRTKTSAKGGITKAEKEKMEEHARLWIARAMRTSPIEPEKIIPAIEKIYRAARLKVPRIVIVPSPVVMAFAYGASAAILYEREIIAATVAATRNATVAATRNATHAATRTATDTATHAATYTATRDATATATHAATDAATDAATRTATHTATHAATYTATRDATATATIAATHAATDAAQACKDLAGEFGLECAKAWVACYQGGNMWASYEAYITATRDILRLELPSHKKYECWESAAINGGFRVMHKEFCIVSDFPEILKIDNENRPHCENGPSHRWRDGWSLYHWHGQEIPSEWIENKESLTAKIALTWKNIEQRRAACEILGWSNILTELDAKIINTDKDPEIGELVEVIIPEIGRERFLRVRCGTGREFAIPVPPKMKTALEAQAWTWGLDKKDFTKPEIRT